MKKKRKKYEKAFKEQAVRLSYERANVSDLAKELGISSAILYRWRQEIAYYKEKSFPVVYKVNYVGHNLCNLILAC